MRRVQEIDIGTKHKYISVGNKHKQVRKLLG